VRHATYAGDVGHIAELLKKLIGSYFRLGMACGELGETQLFVSEELFSSR